MANFIDIDRPATQKFNDLIAKDLDTENLVNGLYDLTREDPNFLDSYNSLYQIALRDEEYQKAEIILNRVYDKALSIVMDNKDQWLGNLAWRHENNQHLIRTLFSKALDFWMEEKFGNALEIMSFLNRSNKDENLGFNYYVLAIKQRITYEDLLSNYLEKGTLNEKGIAWFNQSLK